MTFPALRTKVLGVVFCLDSLGRRQEKCNVVRTERRWRGMEGASTSPITNNWISHFCLSLSSVFCCRAGSGYPYGYPVSGNSRGGFPLPSSRFV